MKGYSIAALMPAHKLFLSLDALCHDPKGYRRGILQAIKFQRYRILMHSIRVRRFFPVRLRQAPTGSDSIQFENLFRGSFDVYRGGHFMLAA